MSEGKAKFELCKVIRADDPEGGDRIITRLSGDNDKTDKELPWAHPMLPKLLHVKPKVGEVVIVFTLNDGTESERFYIGPIITQQVDTYYSPKDSMEIGEARGFLMGAYQTVAQSPETIKETRGALPLDNDVSIEGRKNCGLQITDDDIRLKAGVKKLNISDHTATFNREDPAFIKLKYDDTKPENEYNSVAYIVADRINLLGSNPGGSLKDYKTDTTSEYKDVIVGKGPNGVLKQITYKSFQRDLITDKEEKNILKKFDGKDDDGDRYAYRMVYGEPLIEYLEMFKDAFLNHVHPFPTMTLCKTDEIKNFEDYNLKENLLSNTVRIN